MAAKISRNSLRSYYLRALADEDAVSAQFFFQKMQEYDLALIARGKAAARETLPGMQVLRKGGRLALNKRYLKALRAGDSEEAAALLRRVATRDKSGLADDAPASLKTVIAEFRETFKALR